MSAAARPNSRHCSPADLAAGQLPDIAALRARFAADPAALPEVVVHLTPLIAYEALLGGDIDEQVGVAA